MFKRVARNFLAQFASITLSFLDRFLVAGVLLRSWGPEAYADWTILASAAGLLASFELGLNVYTGNVLQHAFASENQAVFQRRLRVATGTGLMLGLSLASGVCVFWAATHIEQSLAVKHVSREAAIPVFLLLSLAVISRVVRGCISQVYRGRGAFAAGTMVDQASVAAVLAVTLVSVALGAPPLMLAALYVVTDLVMGWGFMLADQRRRFPGLDYRPVIPSAGELQQIGQSARWLAIVQGMPVAWQTLPILALGHLAQTGQVVSFVLIRTLVNLARQIGTMLSISAGVEMSAALYAGRGSDVTRALAAVGALLSAATASLSVLILGFGGAFVQVWSGGKAAFDPAIAFPLLLATVLATPATPVASLLMLGHGPRLLALTQVVQFAAGLGLCVALAPPYGAAGIAAGLAAGEILAFGVFLPRLASSEIGLDLKGYYGACLFAAGRGAALTALMLGLAISIFSQDSALTVVISALLTGLFGFLPAIVWSLPRPQRLRLIQFLTAQGKPTRSSQD